MSEKMTKEEALKALKEAWDLVQGSDTMRELFDSSYNFNGLVAKVQEAGFTVRRDWSGDYLPELVE